MTKITNILTKSTSISPEFFENLPFWKDLPKDRQRTVISGTNRIHNAVGGVIQLRTEAARAAAEVRDALLDGGYWQKYLQSLTQSMRSAYRWLDRLDKLALPAAVLDAAAERGIDVVDGRYFNAIKELPPPKALEGEAVDRYFQKVTVTVRDRRSKAKRARPDPERAELMAWRAVVNRAGAAAAGRARTNWVVRLIGKLMAEFGLPAQRFEPEAVPEVFRAKVGYPKGRPRKTVP